MPTFVLPVHTLTINEKQMVLLDPSVKIFENKGDKVGDYSKIFPSSREQKGVVLNTSTALGDIIAMLEAEFPDFSWESCLDEHLKAIKTGVDRYCLGMVERGHSLLITQQLLGEKHSLHLTEEIVESYFDDVGLRERPFISKFEPNVSISQPSQVSHVIALLLFFYRKYGYKLVKCKHCEKWFATKSPQAEYCPRISPCSGNPLNNKDSSEKVTCKIAVQEMRQRCKYLYSSIYDKAYRANAGTSDFLIEFTSCNDELKKQCKDNPTPKNLRAWLEFLTETNKKREWTHHFSAS